MPEPWLPADQIPAHPGVTKDTPYTWITDKAIPARRVGRLWKPQVNGIDDRVSLGDATVPSPGEDTE